MFTTRTTHSQRQSDAELRPHEEEPRESQIQTIWAQDGDAPRLSRTPIGVQCAFLNSLVDFRTDAFIPGYPGAAARQGWDSNDATSKDIRLGRVHGLRPVSDRLRRAAGGRRTESEHSPVDEPGGRLGAYEHVPPE